MTIPEVLQAVRGLLLHATTAPALALATCATCNGRRVVWRGGEWSDAGTVPCPACNGTGAAPEGGAR